MSIAAEQLVVGFEFATGPTYRFKIVRTWKGSNGRVMFEVENADGDKYTISRVSVLRDNKATAVETRT